METLTKYELRATLHVAGYSQAAFARYIGRSPSFVCELCWKSDDRIPLRWVEQLRSMLGSDVFNTALAAARQKILAVRERRDWIP